jgi:uncharacterized protein
MEEILSSIKRIIAEDADAPVSRRPGSAPAYDSGEEPDVLELTQAVGEPETMAPPAPAEEPAAAPDHDPISAEEAPALAIAPVAPALSTAPARQDADTLISAATADATRQALADLSRMVVRPEEPAGDNTLEGLVRELLRPMLKDWLEANLPRIVQATVDREVARISGRS